MTIMTITAIIIGKSLEHGQPCNIGHLSTSSPPARPMGKWTDKLYITHGEWKSGEFRGGLSKERQQEQESEREYKKLPLDHCALSLQPFNVPVCTREGIIFDLEEIERYIRLESDCDGVCRCPVTGKPLRLQELFRLVFHRNPAGEYACPVTGRVFVDNSRVCASTVSGQVYSAEVVEQMCEAGVDFVSDRPCRRSDYIPIVDPETCASSRNCAPRLAQLKSVVHAAAEDGPGASAPCSSGMSTGRMAAALTSTLLGPVVRQECQSSDSPTTAPRPMRNGRVVVRTTHGDLEAVLFAPLMPITAFNFISRARRGDYCNAPILSISESAWIAGCVDTEATLPCRLKERPHKNLLHNTRGMLGMCIDEDGTTGQFYVTLQATPQFDLVSRVFGKVELHNLGTRDTLAKLEAIVCGPDGSPSEYAAVLDVVVMMDPFSKDDADAMKRCARTSSTGAAKPSLVVGRYLKHRLE